MEASQESRQLALITEASRMLAEARTIPQVKRCRDKVEAVRVFLKAIDAGVDAVNNAVEAKLDCERKAGAMLKAMDKSPNGKTTATTLGALGITHNQSSRWQIAASVPEKEYRAHVDSFRAAGRELTTNSVLKLARRQPVTVEPERDETPARKVGSFLELVGEKFGTVYADPPWQYGNQQTRAATDNHYGTMSVADVCALPVRDHVADDAHLHLWTTNGFLREAFEVIDAWGFEYRSCFVWCKPQMGIGNYWRVSHEFLLLGIRGNAKRFNVHDMMSWAEIDRGEHSAKPERIRGMIERASNGPFLELFGRKPAVGWTVLGNQISEERRIFA